MSNNVMTNKRSLLGVGLVVMLAATPLSLHQTPTKTLSLSLDTATARIGNPASPGSVAGVHRRVYRRTARRNYYGAGAVAAGAAGAAGAAYGGGYNNLYSYAPAADQAATDHPAADHPAADHAAATTDHAATAITSARSMNEGGFATNTASLPPLPPTLYAACLDRTWGNCPH
jgi:hypothetical protein